MEMKTYKVAVTEIYRKVVSVQAENEREAHQRAWDAWKNTEIILGMNDFESAEISVMGETTKNGDKGISKAVIKGFDYGMGKQKGAENNGR